MTGATNFTLQDAVGSAIAVIGFIPVLYTPGYVLAFASNLFGFRRKSLTERSIWAVASSFAIVPIAAYFIGKFAGLRPLCWLLLALTTATAALLFLSRTSNAVFPRTTREKWIIALAISLWITFVIGSLVDLQVGNKLYFSVVLFDQSYRTAFTDAIVRTGIPPANPLYFAGQPQPMHYYYFWYILCACVVRIAHVTARQAFIASSIWAGFGLVSIIALYMRYFFEAARNTRRQTWIALALLAVTGADLLPAIGSIFAQPALNGEMEWWSIDQISSWQDSLLWVPHHTAALICCLFTFLLLWHIRKPEKARQRWPAIALGAIAFASSFGLSVYLAFGFALLMAAWLLRLLVQRVRDSRTAQNLLFVGLCSALILTPFILEMTGGPTKHSSTGAAHVFAFSIRRMIDPELLTTLPVFAGLQHTHPVLLDQTMRILLLLPGLALELGVYAAILIMLLLAKRKTHWQPDEARDTAIYLSVVGLVMVAFIRSSVITNNDFGYRAALLPQFFLLLLAAQMLASWRTQEQGTVAPKPRTKRLIYALLILGVAGTLYQTVMLRAFLPIAAAQSASGFSQLPEDALEARTVFAELNRLAPLNAVISFNPVAPTSSRGDVVPPFQFYQRALLMDSGRQILNAEPECAVEFGGNPEPCKDIQIATANLYSSNAPSAADATEYCRYFGASYLVATHLDEAWNNPTSWIWTLPVISTQPGIRILSCSNAAPPA